MTLPDAFDPVEVLRVLTAAGVRFVVIGGLAAVAHGSPLPTADVDVTPAPDGDNLRKLSSALTELHARVRVDGIPGGLAFAHDASSLAGVGVLTLTTAYGDLDLVMHPAGGATYEELSARGVAVDLGGVRVVLASLADLVASKEAAGRPKDRQALPLLRELRRRALE